MSSITTSDIRQGQNEEGSTLDVISPYDNAIESFDNGESYPDLELFVPGFEKPLQLHRVILTKASEWIKPMLKEKWGQRVTWPYNASERIEKQALLKALRFCYGETLNIGTKNGECCAVIAALSRLQVTSLNEVVPKLCNYALAEARKDVTLGVELLKMCTRYEECCKANTCPLNKELAKILFTKENILEHFREVAIDCLMALPAEYLDEVEYGEPHTKCSEFFLRAKYVRCHSKEMSTEEKQIIIVKCDWSTLNSQELRELRMMDIINKDELLEAHEKALECLEIENENANEMIKTMDIKVKELKRRTEEVESERIALKDLLEGERKTNTESRERSRLQNIFQRLFTF